MNQNHPASMHPPQDTKPRVDPLEPTRKDSIAPCSNDPFDESTPMRRIFKIGQRDPGQAKSPESLKKLKEFLKSSLKAKQRAGASRNADLAAAIATKLPFSHSRPPLNELFLPMATHGTTALKRVFLSVIKVVLLFLIQLFHRETTR